MKSPKRQKTSAATEARISKCSPPGPGGLPLHLAFTSILDIVAQNGWFPWQDYSEARQSPDFSNLRLVSHDIKAMMDDPVHGGPDFKEIADFLNMKIGFDDDDFGFCDHCFKNKGEGCETCHEDGDHYDCTCEQLHRFGPVLLQLDPRLDQSIDFQSLDARERAKRLMGFLRQVADNFELPFVEKWENKRAVEESDDEDERFTPDLTMIDPNIWYPSDDDFINDFRLHNVRFFNFIHHLLFFGWASKHSFGSPGSCCPFRGQLLGDDEDYDGWNGGHRLMFYTMYQCFMRLHKCDDEPENVGSDNSCYPSYRLSQILFLPETIKRCVENTVDCRAEAMLGKPIADGIDLFRMVRETYSHNKAALSHIDWMPCMGMPEEEFVPLTDFRAYNPQNDSENIYLTALLWGRRRG